MSSDTGPSVCLSVWGWEDNRTTPCIEDPWGASGKKEVRGSFREEASCLSWLRPESCVASSNGRGSVLGRWARGPLANSNLSDLQTELQGLGVGPIPGGKHPAQSRSRAPPILSPKNPALRKAQVLSLSAAEGPASEEAGASEGDGWAGPTSLGPRPGSLEEGAQPGGPMGKVFPALPARLSSRSTPPS